MYCIAWSGMGARLLPQRHYLGWRAVDDLLDQLRQLRQRGFLFEFVPVIDLADVGADRMAQDALADVVRDAATTEKAATRSSQIVHRPMRHLRQLGVEIGLGAGKASEEGVAAAA